MLGWDGMAMYLYGSPLRTARFIAALTQEELAAKVGTSRQTIASLERGTSLPSVSLAVALAGELGCTVEALFAAVDRDGPEV